MARIRSIKPEFFKHGDLQDLEVANPGQYVMLVYAGLWTQCDKNGVFFCRARELKTDILPYIDFDMQKTLDILEKEGYFRRFRHKNRDYGYIQNFKKYQFPTKKEKDSPTRYPTPPSGIHSDYEEITGNHAGEVPGEVPGDDAGNHTGAEGLKDKRIEGIQDQRKKDSGSFFIFPVQEKEPENPLPEDQPSKSKEDATAVFQKARNLWNEAKLYPECRVLIIPPAQYDCLLTFEKYSWLEIENAIRNFDWHVKGRCGPGYARPPPYGSIFGFLKAGVPRYFDDDALDSQFKEKEVASGRR